MHVPTTAAEILAQARRMFKIHGPNLSRREFCRITEIPHERILRLFGRWLILKEQAGQKPEWAARAAVSPGRTAHAILAAAKECQKTLGDRLTLSEFQRHTGISAGCVYRQFGSWTALREKLGLKPSVRSSRRLRSEQLLSDMLRVEFVTHRRVTSLSYGAFGRVSLCTVKQRFGSWAAARKEMKKFWDDLNARMPNQSDRLDYIVNQTWPLKRDADA